MYVTGETANKPDQLQLQSRFMPSQSVLYLIDKLSVLLFEWYLLVLRWREEKQDESSKATHPEGGHGQPCCRTSPEPASLLLEAGVGFGSHQRGALSYQRLSCSSARGGCGNSDSVVEML